MAQDPSMMSSRGRTVKLAPWALYGTGSSGKGSLMYRHAGPIEAPVHQELPPEEGSDSECAATPEPVEERPRQIPPREPRRLQPIPTHTQRRRSVPVRDETGKFIGVRPKTAAERAQGGGGIFKRAAVEVLRQELRLMSNDDITRTAFQREILFSKGKTPKTSMATTLYLDVKRKGHESTFIRPLEGRFGLREWLTSGTIFEGMEQAGFAFQGPGQPLVPLTPQQPSPLRHPHEAYDPNPHYAPLSTGQALDYPMPTETIVLHPHEHLHAHHPHHQPAPVPPMVGGPSPPTHLLYAGPAYPPHTGPQGVPWGPAPKKRRLLPRHPQQPAQTLNPDSPVARAVAAAAAAAAAATQQPGAEGYHQQKCSLMQLIDDAIDDTPEELSSSPSSSGSEGTEGGGTDEEVDGMEGNSLAARRLRLPAPAGSTVGLPTDARRVPYRRSRDGGAVNFMPDLDGLVVQGRGLEAAQALQLAPGPREQVAPAGCNIINVPLPEDLCLPGNAA